MNPLRALYNFTDRPWVVSSLLLLTSYVLQLLFSSSLHQFSQLITIQQKLGKDNFPLIEQTFYPNYKEMVSQINPEIDFYCHVSEEIQSVQLTPPDATSFRFSAFKKLM